jgi:hypothetical protein
VPERDLTGIATQQIPGDPERGPHEHADAQMQQKLIRQAERDPEENERPDDR